MQFLTFQFFLFFLGIFVIATLLKENKKYYRHFLLAVSAVFYLFFGVKFFVILLANICVNYLLLKYSEKSGRRVFVLSIIVNVVFLAVFKYYNFGIDALLQVLNFLKIPANFQVLRILIPVGISFYTFRNISHLVDCHRKILPVPSFIDYANYIAFFPQILSGPIARAKEFYANLNEPTLFQYSQGRIITLILSGLLKKYVIASYLFDYASTPFTTPMSYSSLDLVMAAFAYSAMIFVDFSGYSDFAIAISNLLGFDVPPNFLSPYGAIGLKNFWNRWHISLSSWLRDYIYIPLGGSRKGTARKYLNIILTMFISGLWHGAGLNFVVWGLLHGIGSVVSHLLEDKNKKQNISNLKFEELNAQFCPNCVIENNPLGVHTSRIPGGLFVDVDETEFNREVENLLENIDKNHVSTESNESKFPTISQVFGWLATFVFVTFAWIFFTSSSLSNALSFTGSIFVSTVKDHKIISLRLLFVVFIVVLFNFIGNKTFKFSVGFFDKLPLILRIPLVAVLTYVILQLGPETMPPFIYFSF